MADDNDSDNALAKGDSTAAAAIFASIFALGLLAHIVFLARRRAWFCIPFVVGGIMETTGFTTRAIGTTTSTPSIGLKIAQVLNILLAPVVFAAAIYMTLSRIMACASASSDSSNGSSNGNSTNTISALVTATARSTNTTTKKQPKIPHARWITPLFVSGDIACFAVQAIGAGVVAAGGGARTGGDIVLGGLALQIAVFGVFVGVAVRVHLLYGGFGRGEKKRREEGQGEGEEEEEDLVGTATGGGGGGGDTKVTEAWQSQMVGLYVMSAFVMARNLYRVVEYCMGADGYLMQHEWPLYVFDAAMMVVVMSVGLRCYSLKGERHGGGADKGLRGIEGEGFDMSRC